MKCPVCEDVSLSISARDGVEIDFCPQCRGVWLDRGELDKILDRVAAALPPVALAPDPAPRVDDRDRRPDDRGDERPRYDDRERRDHRYEGERRYDGDRRDDSDRRYDRAYDKKRRKRSMFDDLFDVFD